MQLGFRDDAALIEKSPLKNNLVYLRVNLGGLDALLVKGYVDQDPRGPIDVWYSSDGSIMRIQAGRYLGSVGFDQNWQELSRKDAPNLEMILNNAFSSNQINSVSNKQATNSSSSNLFGVKKYFSTQSYISIPSHLVMRDERISATVSTMVSGTLPETIPSSFKKYLANKNLIWVSETPQPEDLFKKKGASFGWYGFIKNKDTYQQIIGQQCFSNQFCITWMPWPLQP
ncbi:hypothetical protein [Polynucleobacter kasalickyi]|uniref:Uncharacterized protein n=1 Tax=Polynucleobacter kasalickyi TaxID=1938817 RepID=A0A1W2CBC9_9BURK|nr:hypothetical protein [Polynucleobacter kasalickyi]SMC81958.1 hypothetical protein SAMN06296008_1212 [Polynucleobacter kasalickyi]